MNDPRDIKARLIAIAEPVCAANGYELVDLDYESGNGGWVVRFYIDHAPGHVSGLSGGISFSDCEALSRELGVVLDVEDPVPHAYRLEISSPGVDRPLRKADHFRQHLGETAKIELHHGLDGRRNFKGTVEAVEARDGGEVVVVDVDGQRFELPVADLSRARLVPDWDAILKGPGAGHPDSQPGSKKQKKAAAKAPKAKPGTSRSSAPGSLPSKGE
jgi:ribosome maturation factor RimP